MFPLHR